MKKIIKMKKEKDAHLELKEKICEALEGNNISKIIIDGKVYYITLKEIGHDGVPGKWICAYVDLKGVKKNDLDNQTYHTGDTYGVDTAHTWNDNMSLEEKKKDAIRQIKELIKSALK